MEGSVLNGKRVLVVENDPDVLRVMEEEILRKAPNCYLDKATRYSTATELLESYTYDLVILDSLSVRSANLLSLGVTRIFPLPVVMLASHSLSPGVLCFEKMGARICLPRENLGEVIPFLEDVVGRENLPGWRRLLEVTVPFQKQA
jgi:hypothetical protein